MKVAIVGAGPAGLFTALELKNCGVDFDIFESHSKPGGCASYFRRQVGNEKILFDAGATVLWALSSEDKNNSFLRRKFLEWKIEPPHFHKSSFHRYQIGKKSFELNSRSEKSWIDSLIREFPEDRYFIDKYFPSFFKVAQKLNTALYKIPAEPFLEITALFKNLSLTRELLAVLPLYLQWPKNFSDLLDRNNLSPQLRQWIEMQLLITLQCRSEEVETLYGAAALCFFPMGGGTIRGGMYSLFQSLTQPLNLPTEKLHFRHKVLSIKNQQGYSLLVQQCANKKEWGPYSALFLSCPQWNSEELFKDSKLPLFEDRQNWEVAKDKLWSAVVAYLAIKDSPEIPADAYNHQVKVDDQEFYFSVSKRDDPIRGSQTLRCVTVSTHEKLDAWREFNDYKKKDNFPSKDIYLLKKSEWEKRFRNVAELLFPNAIAFLEVGSPKTFQHYTQRKEGFVGGIPLTQDNTLLKSPSQRTRLPRVYQIGDTSFPGQSVVSCAIGALEAIRKFKSDT